MKKRIRIIPPEFGTSPFFSLDADCNIVSVNEAALKITGLPINEINGANFCNLFAEPIKANQSIQQAIESGSNPNFLLTFVNAFANTTTDAISSAFCSYNTADEISDIHVITNPLHLDLNSSGADHSKMLKELSDYKYALDETFIVAITNQFGIIKYVNNNFCKISQYSKEELIGQDHRIINSGHHPKSFIKNLWETITAGKPWKGELKNKAKDGTYYWVYTVIIPFLDKNLRPYQFWSIRIDISEFKIIEDKQRLQLQIIQSSDDAIISKDLNGIITSWNKGAESIFGYSESEMIGNNISVLIPEDRYNEEPYIIAKIKAGEYVDHYETQRRKKNGRLIYVSLTVSPIKDSRGEIIGASKIARDVTERKNLEEKLKKLNDELETRVKERTEEIESFSYSVSHDLRTPLRAVDGYANILQEDYGAQLDLEANRLLAEVQQNAKKMGQLIDDLLAFSKLGRKEVACAQIDMDNLTATAIHEISQSVAHHAQIRYGNLYPVMGDYALLLQVMLNLISNAIKYSSKSPQPVIEINSAIGDGEFIFSVTDNGVGFDMQYVHKLFGVFQRLHSNEEFPGTGVGLAITKRIIEKHKGRIWARSKLGEGSSFYFALPVSE